MALSGTGKYNREEREGINAALGFQQERYASSFIAMLRHSPAGGRQCNCRQILAELSNIFYLQGDLEAFKRNIREALSLKNHLPNNRKIYLLMTILDSLYLQRPEITARLLGILDHSERKYDFPLNPAEKRYWDRAETHARQMLGDAAFESAFAEGGRMSLDEGLDLASKTVEEM